MHVYPANNAVELREQIRRGEYRIDVQAVADALVRRLRGPVLGLGPIPAAGSLHRRDPGRVLPSGSPATAGAVIAGP
jgi:Anti-sigma-28 factor, FlgM